MLNPVIKNVSFVFVANVIATAVTAVLTIWIPKALSYEGYGYWQLNMLYSSYVALLHFGLVDGVYLRYAGTNYYQLNKEVQRAQFRLLLFFELLVSVLAILACLFFIDNPDKKFAVSTVFVTSVITIPMGMLLFLLQGGGRVKEYSISTIINRLVYLALCVVLLTFGFNNYKLIIVASIVGSIIAFSYSCWLCRDIVFGKIHLSKGTILKESYENIKCGIKISIAYITGNLIIGAVRLGIENEWGIETFGKVSMVLSLTHFMLIFINAVGVVLLPILRNVTDEMQGQVYINLNKILTTTAIVSFALCLPLQKLLNAIIPQYSDSIEWLPLLIPILLFEARIALLNGVYMRANRKENALFLINVFMALASVIATFITVKFLHSFLLSVLLIPLLIGINCTCLDIFVNRHMGISNVKETLYGIVAALIIIIINLSGINDYVGLSFYIIIITTLLLFDRKNQINAFTWFITKAVRN